MLKLDFSPFPPIETPRLLLREIKPNDAADIFAFRSNEKAMRYIGKPLAATIEEIMELVKRIEEGIAYNLSIAWGIGLKNSKTIIGTIGYHKIEFENHRAEIGYMLHPTYWRQGYMNEAVQAVLDYGFKTIKFHSIQAVIDPKNEASSALLSKFHFVREAYFKENYFFKDSFLDSAVYSLLKKDYMLKNTNLK